MTIYGMTFIFWDAPSYMLKNTRLPVICGDNLAELCHQKIPYMHVNIHIAGCGPYINPRYARNRIKKMNLIFYYNILDTNCYNAKYSLKRYKTLHCYKFYLHPSVCGERLKL
jgi:hypothetical protein